MVKIFFFKLLLMRRWRLAYLFVDWSRTSGCCICPGALRSAIHGTNAAGSHLMNSLAGELEATASQSQLQNLLQLSWRRLTSFPVLLYFSLFFRRAHKNKKICFKDETPLLNFLFNPKPLLMIFLLLIFFFFSHFLSGFLSPYNH